MQDNHQVTAAGKITETCRIIRTLFPATVAIQLAEDWMWQKPLGEQEETLSSGASAKRKQEFRAGRHCAHAALAQLGCAEHMVLRGENGEPLWPAGFCGTITHSGKLCAAAVASQHEIKALGMDIEQHRALKPGVLAKVATEAEIARLDTLQQKNPGTHYDVLLFSIKEAVYKAYFPLTHRRLGFHDVDVVIDAITQRFSCRVLEKAVGIPSVLAGKYAVVGATVCAALTVDTQSE